MHFEVRHRGLENCPWLSVPTPRRCPEQEEQETPAGMASQCSSARGGGLKGLSGDKTGTVAGSPATAGLGEWRPCQPHTCSCRSVPGPATSQVPGSQKRSTRSFGEFWGPLSSFPGKPSMGKDTGMLDPQHWPGLGLSVMKSTWPAGVAVLIPQMRPQLRCNLIRTPHLLTSRSRGPYLIQPGRMSHCPKGNVPTPDFPNSASWASER